MHCRLPAPITCPIIDSAAQKIDSLWQVHSHPCPVGRAIRATSPPKKGPGEGGAGVGRVTLPRMGWSFLAYGGGEGRAVAWNDAAGLSIVMLGRCLLG